MGMQHCTTWRTILWFIIKNLQTDKERTKLLVAKTRTAQILCKLRTGLFSISFAQHGPSRQWPWINTWRCFVLVTFGSFLRISKCKLQYFFPFRRPLGSGERWPKAAEPTDKLRRWSSYFPTSATPNINVKWLLCLKYGCPLLPVKEKKKIKYD